MANKMKAAVLHEFNQPLQIEEVDIPTVGAGQILVKMEASGVPLDNMGMRSNTFQNKNGPATNIQK